MKSKQQQPARSRKTALGATAGLLAASVPAATAGVLVSETPAGAICGLNDEFTYPIDRFWGREEGYGDPQCGSSGTSYPFGNNGHYRGKVFDPYTDGSCVSVRYKDLSYDAIQASSCDSAGNIYDFYDQTGDNAAEVRLERNQGVTIWYTSRGY